MFVGAMSELSSLHAVLPGAPWASLSLQSCVSPYLEVSAAFYALSAHRQVCVKAGSRVCRVNITLGPKEERLLMTGLHTVADIYCTCCSTVLGWKYVSCCISLLLWLYYSSLILGIKVHLLACYKGSGIVQAQEGDLQLPMSLQERAFEESQKYKEGKYILEKAKLMKVLNPKNLPVCQHVDCTDSYAGFLTCSSTFLKPRVIESAERAHS